MEWKIFRKIYSPHYLKFQRTRSQSLAHFKMDIFWCPLLTIRKLFYCTRTYVCHGIQFTPAIRAVAATPGNFGTHLIIHGSRAAGGAARSDTVR